MIPWGVTWTGSAARYYLRMEKGYQEMVQQAVRELEADPFSSQNIKRLRGELEGLYRYRLGRFRMIFRILEDAREVRILAIASRGDIYK